MIRERVTVPSIRNSKVRLGHEPISMITAYDFPGARMVDQAGADMILVGDSLAMVVLGHKDTLSVTIDDMVHHTKAVAAADPLALIVTDMPWMSYHTGTKDAVVGASKLIRAGASAVKIEGGAIRAKVIKAIVEAEIPVVGHLGLTPQSVNKFGGFRVQAKSNEQAQALLEDAKTVEAAGAFCLVLEAIPDVVAKAVTNTLSIPTIGIGAGAQCDGQVLVFHDILGYGSKKPPKFVKRYANLEELGIEGLARYVKDVRTGHFPDDTQTYHDSDGVISKLY
ncbi:MULTISPECIES: 3-methyl-2-oxobutanoate hydroxymethyltransferase [Acidithrix]|uniref:3-methyl-2-oxobutanoate hydroxymethyltransferase n=1 Tax=Acidithrix ferrooxidans TaxID=1280514 RepID=A0A0D8HG03_9ACTN|nr:MULTISPECIES: 3-methyl-2-oxobutanoate hydroxymethyltransferase [Acidithrix]KJF16737.1 3-methyl-2-oxobutanoate hydroxymethyltransferase [Acidithrix ferrooxidans]CAG4934372.1 unnamed protein product [Acidithrix sp. C25]